MATTTAVADLNRVQYIGLDFPTLFDDLRSELQTKFAADFNDFALSSLAIMLTDLTAYGLDSLAFYLDRRASDAYLETAQTRKAVSRLSRQLGYKMGGAVSSSTDLSVSVKVPVNFQVTIPKGFQFLGPNSLIFEAGESLTFPAQSGPANVLTVPVYEGETLVESFVGDGTANQVFKLRRVPSGKGVVQKSVTVLVNGATFTEVDFLPITGGQFYEVGYNDDPPTVRFGDGTVSQADVPPSGATVTVTYIAAKGLGGQVAANTITKVVSNLVVNFQTISLNITNTEAAVGGDDPESLDSAKANAGYVYKSRQVAITQPDYLALASVYADPLYGRVAVAQAYSSRSASSDLQLNILLDAIKAVAAGVYAPVDAQIAVIAGLVTSITAACTGAGGITAQTSTITSKTTAIGTSVNAAIADLDSIEDYANRLAGNITSAKTTVGATATSAQQTLTTAASFNLPASTGSTVSTTVTTAMPDGLAIGQAINAYSPAGVLLAQFKFRGGYTSGVTHTIYLEWVTTGTAGSPVASGSLLTPTATSYLSPTDKGLLTSLLNSAGTDAASILTEQGSAVTSLNAALTSNTDTQTANASIITSKNTIVTSAAGITTALNTIQTEIDVLAPGSTAVVSIDNTCAAVYDHVDGILSADCEANLVTVPILTRDADGFYAAPPFGLQQSLQAYLEARKAVTQSVQVTSGASSLIPVQLDVRVGVRQGFSENAVRLAVESAVNGLLKDREFGVSLYRSDIVNTVLAVAGVAFADPRILGPTTYLDAYGNLLVDQSKIITKGSLSVTTEALF